MVADGPSFTDVDSGTGVGVTGDVFVPSSAEKDLEGMEDRGVCSDIGIVTNVDGAGAASRMVAL